MKGVVNGYELITLSLYNGKRTIRVTFLIDGKPYLDSRTYENIDEKQFLAINELLEDYMGHNKNAEERSSTIPWTTTLAEMQRIIYG